MTSLDRQFSLTASTNSEIAHAWFRLAIATNYSPAGKTTAAGIYERARPGYHTLTRQAVEELLRPAIIPGRL